MMYLLCLLQVCRRRCGVDCAFLYTCRRADKLQASNMWLCWAHRILQCHIALDSYFLSLGFLGKCFTRVIRWTHFVLVVLVISPSHLQKAAGIPGPFLFSILFLQSLVIFSYNIFYYFSVLHSFFLFFILHYSFPLFSLSLLVCASPSPLIMPLCLNEGGIMFLTHFAQQLLLMTW